MSDWIAITERMPQPQKLVLIAYRNHFNRPVVTMGWHCPAKTVESQNFTSEVDDEYDEERDAFYLKEQWVDESAESEYHYSISNVTHWKPMPDHPELEGRPF